MRKWNPVYRVTVYTKDETIQVTLPLTCQMTVTRSMLTQNTTATIQLYNLSETRRRQIDQPPFQALSGNAKFIAIEAGYGDLNSMYLIFKGYILEAYSSKQGGATDVITTIQANALDMLTAYSSHQFEAGTEYKDIIKTLAADMPNCTIGNIGALEGTLKTATTFEGNTLEQMNKVSDGCTFIDNGQINTILSNEVIKVPVPVITDSNALLQTPKRGAANLTIKILFEPSLIINQLLEIHSTIVPDYDGQYKVLGFTHNLYFSASTDGQRTTDVELWYGKNLQNSPLYVSGDKVQEGFNKVEREEVTPVEASKISTNWIMPCKGRISSKFGKRNAPVAGASTEHKGIDIAVPIGTPIVAIADGSVFATNQNSKGYGKAVFLNHGKVNGKLITSEYGHLSRISVSAGAFVKQGQIIAYSGNTGTSSGPHCHLTIREGTYKGKPVDPLNYIKNA